MMCAGGCLVENLNLSPWALQDTLVNFFFPDRG